MANSTRPHPDQEMAPPLPQDLGAERAVLGAVLLDANYLADAAGRLTPDQFFLPEHRHIFSQMLDMSQRHIAIDLQTLISDLDRVGDLEAAGGAGYLAALIDGVPRASNVGFYAEIVREKAILRRVIYSTTTLQEQAFAGEDADTILERAKASINLIAEARSTPWREKFHLVEELTEREVIHLIDSVLPEGVAFLGGLSGAGKTWFALSMSRALISGQKFLGLFRVPEPQNVLYLVPEMGEAAFKKRCKRLGIGGPRFRCQTISDGTIDLADPKLQVAVREFRPVIFLDTSIRFSNAESENSAAENRALARAIFALVRTGAKAVVCLHHRGKSNAKTDELTLENALRGTTDLGAIADVVIGLKYDSFDNHSVYLKESKKLVRLDVCCVKSRDFAPPEDFRIQLFPFLDEIGDFAVLTEQPPQQEPEIDRLLSAIQENPLATKVQLQQSTGIGRNRISKLAATAGWHYEPIIGWRND